MFLLCLAVRAQQKNDNNHLESGGQKKVGFRVSRIASLSNRNQKKARPKRLKLVGTNLNLPIYGSLGKYHAQLSTTIFCINYFENTDR